MKKIVLILGILLSSCASTQLISNWKNPDTVLFHANKVLIVGMTQNERARLDFETKLKNEFTKKDVEAFRSIDLFDVAFIDSSKSEEELSEVEEQLLQKDFDAILFTKVVGSKNRQTFKTRLSEINNLYGSFKDDYLSHQNIYYDDGYYNNYTVYNLETSLYCICVGKERELIWRGIVEVEDPVNINKTVKDYVKLVISEMEAQDLVFYEN
ncbi:hypothetical protein GGR42_001797 [Saonia flava]|uniref:Cardiolipin synthetase n=1 Tax=Saonia flava TaxID=523696 RepID=A0A846R094_9FLAO|nr:hypothetical protein [Saonia flava]NJB71335.1 hypothetical protein [Saonia flava]